jgi:hypothetical protein
MNALVARVTRRPSVVVAAGVALAVALGLFASVRPLEIQAVIVVPLLVHGALSLYRRGFARYASHAWLYTAAKRGLVLRVAFVALHIAIGVLFYGGKVDFIGWQRQVTDAWMDIVTGEASDFDTLTGTGIGNYGSFALLMALGAVTGPTLLGMFLGAAVLGMTGAYLFLRAYQRSFPEGAEQRFLPLTLFYLPSVGFWSIFLGKDCLAFLALGASTWALARLQVERAPRHLLSFAASGAALLMVRPHMGVAVAAGFALSVGFRPLARHGASGYLRPVKRLALLGIVAVLGAYVATLGLLQLGVQAVTLEGLAERAYMQQRGFAETEAASRLEATIESGDPEDVVGSIPFGVFTLLFRPLPWEAHNALALAAAADNVLLLGLVLWRWRALLASLRALHRQPLLVFCLTVFAVGAVALSFNWNLGTLARHRTMVLPFLLILLAGPPDASGRRRATATP